MRRLCTRLTTLSSKTVAFPPPPLPLPHCMDSCISLLPSFLSSLFGTFSSLRFGCRACTPVWVWDIRFALLLHTSASSHMGSLLLRHVSFWASTTIMQTLPGFLRQDRQDRTGRQAGTLSLPPLPILLHRTSHPFLCGPTGGIPPRAPDRRTDSSMADRQTGTVRRQEQGRDWTPCFTSCLLPSGWVSSPPTRHFSPPPPPSLPHSPHPILLLPALPACHLPPSINRFVFEMDE